MSVNLLRFLTRVSCPVCEQPKWATTPLGQYEAMRPRCPTRWHLKNYGRWGWSMRSRVEVAERNHARALVRSSEYYGKGRQAVADEIDDAFDQLPDTHQWHRGSEYACGYMDGLEAAQRIARHEEPLDLGNAVESTM